MLSSETALLVPVDSYAEACVEGEDTEPAVADMITILEFTQVVEIDCEGANSLLARASTHREQNLLTKVGYIELWPRDNKRTGAREENHENVS